jgi:hypothetical protein
VDYAFLMRGLKGIEDLMADADRLRKSYPAVVVSNEVSERVPVDEFENQEAPFTDLLEPIDLGDVRMIESREDLRLTLETRYPFRIVRENVWQRLDRHVAA